MSRHRHKKVWVISALGALAVLCGSAPASFADSTLVTSHPDLTAAQVLNSKQVLACFDEILATPLSFTDANFFLQGYTESRKTGGASGLTLATETSSGGGFCVVAAYTGTGDVRTYSRLVVLAGAVNSAIPGGGGVANVQDAASLLGSSLPNIAGLTTRPELLAAAPSGANTLAYTFDESLSAAGAGTKFGFYDSVDSSFHAGTVINFTPGTVVTATFSAADVALFPQATRFVAGEGAVTDANGLVNPLTTVGGLTQLADLAGTTGLLAAAGGITYHFDFNKPIPATAVVCPPAFAAFDVAGVRYTPTAAAPTISADRRSVTLVLAPDTPGGDPAQITLATVARDGIDANACGAATPAPVNSDGIAALPGTTARAGATSGPDVVSFTINRTTGFASFVFDKPVSAAGVTPSGFHLVDRSASLTAPPSQSIGCLLGGQPAETFDVNPSNTVNVNFSTPTCALLNLLLPGPPNVTAARNAVGVTVDEGAITDPATGVLSPVGSLGTGATTPPGPTTPPAPPIPPSALTPTTPTTPTTTMAACRRIVTIHLLTTISRVVKSATVTVNGKKLAVSKKLTVTIPFTSYRGVKLLTVKITAKLKTNRTVKQTRTYKNKC